MKNRNTLTCFAVSLLGLMICAEPSYAAEKRISGTISTTLTVTEDSELTGNVTCMVVGGPCIAFGAKDIQLRLNGFTMMGTDTTCTPATSFDDGIDVIQLNDVTIQGPGLIKQFGGFGIFLASESGVKIRGITVTDSCFSGIFLGSVTDSEIEGNTSVRNSIGSEGSPCGGT